MEREMNARSRCGPTRRPLARPCHLRRRRQLIAGDVSSLIYRVLGDPFCLLRERETSETDSLGFGFGFGRAVCANLNAPIAITDIIAA